MRDQSVAEALQQLHQHQPYLDEFNKGKGTDLVSVAGVHIEPFGAYLSLLESLDELPNGAKIGRASCRERV